MTLPRRDLAGRCTRLTHPDGFYVDQDYLVTGEMAAIRENGATSGVGVLATFGYDDLGRRTSLTFGNGDSASYGYDSLSRLSQLGRNLAGTANDLILTFAYNPASQIASTARSNDLYAWTGHGSGTCHREPGANLADKGDKWAQHSAKERRMFYEIAASILAVPAPQAPDPAGSPDADDKPIFVRSYEHSSPTVREYKVAGSFGTQQTPYALSLRFRAGQWDVQLENGSRAPLKVRLDKAYNSIAVSRIVVAMEHGESRFVVLIPFGKPHPECFANGEDVYSQLSVGSEGRVRLEHFPKCAFEETAPPVSQSRGALLVGPPPQVR